MERTCTIKASMGGQEIVLVGIIGPEGNVVAIRAPVRKLTEADYRPKQSPNPTHPAEVV